MIRGQVVFVGQLQQGIGKTSGKEWKKQEYAIQTDGQYSKKVAFSLMNDKIAQANIQMGQTIEIEIDAQSREYQGKWYTELTAWRVNNLGNAPQQFGQPNAQSQSVYQQSAPQGYQQPAPPPSSSDMPF